LERPVLKHFKNSAPELSPTGFNGGLWSAGGLAFVFFAGPQRVPPPIRSCRDRHQCRRRRFRHEARREDTPKKTNARRKPARVFSGTR